MKSVPFLIRSEAGLSDLATVIERGRHLAAMLSGQVDPVSVIFPDGSSEVLTCIVGPDPYF